MADRARPAAGPTDREPPGLSYCAAQVRRYDRDRYLTALLAPRDCREDLMAVYAFNTEIARIREAVTEPMMGQIRLQWWRDSLAEACLGRPRRHHVVVPLAGAIARHALPRDAFERLIDTREQDLAPGPPPSMAALLDYAEGTSSPLVTLALSVLGSPPAKEPGHGLVAAGRALGIGWALVGLLRAVPYHARAGRLYLPPVLLERHGVRRRDVLECRPSAGLAAAVDEVAVIARGHLAEARGAVVPRRLRSPFLLATLADLHLRRLARAGCNVFDPAVGAVSPDRLWRLLLTAWLGRF
jgi:phytoene synthase